MSSQTTPDPASDPVSLARSAAEAIRTLGHHLTGEQLDVDEVYDLFGELTFVTSRFPHLLTAVEASLAAAADRSLIAVDETGQRHDPTDTLTAIAAHLATASDTAHALTDALDAAHEHTAHLARS